MKKWLCLLLAGVLTFSLAACHREQNSATLPTESTGAKQANNTGATQPDNTEVTQPNNTEETQPNDTEATQSDNLEETKQSNSLQGQNNPLTKEIALLLSVLNNENAFIDETGKSVYLKNYKIFSDHGAMPGAATIPQKYALVDFDNDGTDELVVYVTPDFGAYLVFHIYNDRVYGFEFTARAITDLKKDGTFTGSSGAGNNMYVTLSFKDHKYELYELAYRYDMPENKIYRLNGRDVTAEDFAVFYEEFKNKPEIDWVKIAN